MTALLVSFVLAGAIVDLEGAVPQTTLRVLDGKTVDPYLFGYNAEAYIGITLNKLFNDTAGIAAAKALHAGVFRYPGGTLSNLWNPRTGQYVEPGPFAHGYPSGYDKWQVWGKEINSQYPKGTFTAEEYLTPGNLGSVTKRTLWCLNVYSFNVSETCDQIAYIGGLPGQQVPGVVLELGNELYIGNQGGPKFPNSESYGEQMTAIVQCARQHMPNARVAAVGAPGRWNQGLKATAHQFDAISWHAYQPGGSSVNEGGRNNMTSLVERVSFVAGYGKVISDQAVAQQQAELGVAKPIAHTEFGYGLDRPGHCVLGTLGVNGALHGAFHISRIIYAINHPGSYAAITLESFVGGTPVAGPNVPVDPQAGNRTDYWCGLAVTTVPTFHSNRPDLAQISGTGQVFAHFAASAFRSDATLQRPVAVDNGPSLPFPILGQQDEPCLQAVAFSEPLQASAEYAKRAEGGILMTLAVLNICNRTIPASIEVEGSKAGHATLYYLVDGGKVDPGPLNQKGWSPLPQNPDVLPYDGTLTLGNATFTADSGGNVPLEVPRLTFAIIDFV